MPGLPKSIIKKYGISKKAWRIYKASKGKSKSKRSSPKRKTTVGKRRKKRRRRGPKTIPILPIIGVGVGLAEPVINMVSDPSVETIKNSLNHIGLIYSGFNAIEGQFQPDMLMKGLVPAIAGAVGHKLCNMFGLNRAFANLPSPLNKLRL